ncbi:thiosulfate dehydrogenase [quinone] large subunit [Micromonospora phaseoli]|uniref:Thiosulfate dehydrogenase [quinone] large subunit n=2 Tax=Micromonospora phaseoli TaxID=1144548 RepID=A0A1H6YUW9_9ACTN|nr:thiosulfate dehydrogenase [quinone] large subunit [Micromonospora phaseoli]SEJ44106.1 thiosulfate dehydrogenase [quinone] large subunit [Micromonospora phaseoli]
MTATTKRNTAAVNTPGAETIREQTTRQQATRYLLGGLRLALGWIFLWAFLDKMFGLGFATEAKNAWIDGGSPTKGFLSFGAAGPFQGFYNSIAGAAWADWLFMIGLAAIGTALMLGIGVRVAAAAGGLMLVLMWTAVLPPENNPFMDDHLIYAGVLALLAVTNAGDNWGLGRTWARLPIVQRFGWLR